MTDDVTTGATPQPPQTPQADAIRALIDERERYESWLTALEARRAATPAHVFERVYGDYDGRLRGVRDKLAEHVGPLREVESDLVRQHEEVGRRLSERQDELAELELRTLVGEFDRDEGERRVQAAATGVRELEGERRGASDRLTDLRSLIERAQGTGAAPAPAAPAAPEPAAAESRTEPVAATAADAPTSDRDVAAVDAPDEPAPVEPFEVIEPAAATATAPAAEEWSGALDEDGFVGTGQRLDALAASLGGAVAPPPPAAASAGQEKTLRCQECGEMNYPTEWYCERCGGELAAL